MKVQQNSSRTVMEELENSGMQENVFFERRRLGFLGLPFTPTTYQISPEKMTVSSGLLAREEEDCYMYRIQNVLLKRTILNRIFGIGTVYCYADFNKRDQRFVLKNVRHSKAIKDFILAASEQARMALHTIPTMSLNPIYS